MTRNLPTGHESDDFSVHAADPSFCGGLSIVYRSVTRRGAEDLLGRLGKILDPKKAGEYLPRVGEYAHGYVYDGSMIVKESRAEAPLPYIGAAHLEQEQDVLRHLARYKMPVPRALFTDRHATLFITTRVPGAPLGDFHYAHINEGPRAQAPLTGRQKVKLARDIVDFMARLGEAFADRKTRKLLRVPAGQRIKEDALRAALGDVGVKKELGNRYNYIHKMMEEYIGRFGDKKRPAIPAKLSSRVIMLDPETRAFTGVSDMTGVRKGRPEEALLELYRTYPADFSKLLCRTYSRRTGQKIELRDMVLCDVADHLLKAGEYAAEGKKLLMAQAVSDLLAASGNNKGAQKAKAKTAFAAALKSPETPPKIAAQPTGKEPAHELPRPSAPRRKRVEQGKPLHGL